MRAAARACTRVFGAVPSLVRSGGSIPAAGLFREHLGIETVLMGFALPDDGMHAPNERFSLANFRAAIHSSLAFMEELARVPKGRRWAGAAGAATAHRPALTG